VGCGAADGSSATKPGVNVPDNALCLAAASVSEVRTETRQPTIANLTVGLSPHPSIPATNPLWSPSNALISGTTNASDLDIVITCPPD